MKTEDILKLIEAGFTKEEILALEKAADPKPEKKTSPAESPAALSPKAEAPAPETKTPEQPKPQNDEIMGKLLNSIDQLGIQIQKMNLQNSNIPGADEKTTPEDILANIINPPLKMRNLN